MSGKWLRRKTGEEAPRFSRVQIDLRGRRDLALRRPAAVRAAAAGEAGGLRRPPGGGGAGARSAGRAASIARTWPRACSAARSRSSRSCSISGWCPAWGTSRPARRCSARHRPTPPRRDPDPRRGGAPGPRHRASIDLHAEGPAGPDRPPASDVRYVEEPAGPNPFRVYDRAGEPCPRGRQGTITRLVQDGRATFFCPRCQK